MLSEIAVLRFGLGARPGELTDAAHDPRGWLVRQLSGPVPLASSLTLTPSASILADVMEARQKRRQARADGSAATPAATAAAELVKQAWLPHYREQVLARTQSAVLTDRPFAERLVQFWSNHFAVSADKGLFTGIAGTLENEAIRPHACGHFADLLRAVEQHPAMILFLDNQASVGPNSRAQRLFARRDPQHRHGINENLARETLELHTLGVNGGYTQADVTSFARVLTGWSVGRLHERAPALPGAFVFREAMHEPGAQIVLGLRFAEDGIAQGEAVLDMLARHPSTARFLATKLARHFIADDPPPAAVDRLARAYQDSEGFLPSVYQALVEEQLAWQMPSQKFKTPQDLVFSTLRTLGIEPSDPGDVLPGFEFLGQRTFTPGSPAGWPDTARNWDGPDALMHRVLWATRVGERFEHGLDPQKLCDQALGRCARPETRSAVAHAATGAQALALLIMSPEFQRR